MIVAEWIDEALRVAREQETGRDWERERLTFTEWNALAAALGAGKSAVEAGLELAGRPTGPDSCEPRKGET